MCWLVLVRKTDSSFEFTILFRTRPRFLALGFYNEKTRTPWVCVELLTGYGYHTSIFGYVTRLGSLNGEGYPAGTSFLRNTYLTTGTLRR